MPTSATEFQAKVDKTGINMDRFDGFINGNDTTDVVTDTGSVPSIAKLQKANAIAVGQAEADADRAEDAADAATAITTNLRQVATAVPSLTANSVISRRVIFERPPTASSFAVNGFGGLTVVALGSDLGTAISGFETWLQTPNPAVTLSYKLWSRTRSGADIAGPGIAGDVAVFSVTRPIGEVGMITDGLIHRVLVDFIAPFKPAADAIYFMELHLLDASGNDVLFGFLNALGVNSGEPGFPQANGYYQNGITNAWTNFAGGDAAGMRWLLAESGQSSVFAAGIAALEGSLKGVKTGAPEGLLTTASGSLPFAYTWWHERPALQSGLATRIFVKGNAVGYANIVFGTRSANGVFTIRHSVPVKIAVGNNSYVAGIDFEAFPVRKDWYVGVKTTSRQDCVAFSQIGNAFQDNTYFFRGATPAIGVEMQASPLPVTLTDFKRRRVSIWREKIGANAPAGWDVDQNIIYSSTGMKLGTPGNAYNNQVSSHRPVQTDRRLTRVIVNWIQNNAIFVVATKGAPNDIADLGYDNSGVRIDGQANKIAILSGFSGSNTAPGTQAEIALGFPMTVGHQYLIEWGLDYTVHSARITDLTANVSSPVLTSGDPNFNGVFTNEGYQNGALAFAYPFGNTEVSEVEVLHDEPSPDIYVIGDSMAKMVYNGPNESWAGLLRAAGAKVMLSAQPGGSTELGRRVADWEIRAVRPTWVIIALGANDAIQGKSVTDFKWEVQNVIDNARRVGARIVLQVLHPNRTVDPTAYRNVILDLAAGQSDIFLWRWDKALTVNADGATPNETMLYPTDGLHPVPSGSTALYARLLADVPSIMD